MKLKFNFKSAVNLKPLGLFFICCSPLVFIQNSNAELFDKILAVVDDEIILQSDLAELTAMYAEQPQFAEMTDQQKQEFLLNKMIDDKVLLVVAEKDTNIDVSDAEVELGMDSKISERVQQFGGEDRFESLLKQYEDMTLLEFKKKMREKTREELLKQRLRMKYVGNSEPSQLEVKEFYKQMKDSLPLLYKNFKLSHLELGVKADSKLLGEAYKKCDSVIQKLNEGQKFEELAKKYSDDPSGQDGGDLGFTKRGTLDPSYERAAYNMQVGEFTRKPVHTPFGYHVIKVTDKKDMEVKTSHILIQVTPTAEDTLRTLTLLDSIRIKAEKDTSHFSTTVRELSEDKMSKDKSGSLGWFTEQALTPEYRAIVDTLKAGQISSPVLLGTKYHLFKLDEFKEERPLSLEEDWDQLNYMAKNYILSKKMDGYVSEWKKSIYIDNRSSLYVEGKPLLMKN